MFRKLLAASCILSVALALPLSDDAGAKILSYENRNDGSGNYEFSYETSNGLFQKETGELVNAGRPDAHIVVRGEYSFRDDQGDLHILKYVGDENGFQITSTSDDKITPPQLGVPAPVIATLLG